MAIRRKDGAALFSTAREFGTTYGHVRRAVNQIERYDRGLRSFMTVPRSLRLELVSELHTLTANLSMSVVTER